MLRIGGACNLAALQRFLDAYLGLKGRHPLMLSPDVGWLVKRANDPSWDVETHLLELLASHGSASAQNLGSIIAVVSRRSHGLRLLLGALVTYSLAAFYILGRSVGT